MTTLIKLEMTLPVRADLRAQAEMLRFLVVSHLATKFATHRWMSIEDTVASSNYWSKSMQRDEDAVLQAILGNRALSIAKTIEVETGLTLSVSALASLFDSSLRWTSRLSLLATFTTAVTRIFLRPSSRDHTSDPLANQ